MPAQYKALLNSAIKYKNFDTKYSPYVTRLLLRIDF